MAFKTPYVPRELIHKLTGGTISRLGRWVKYESIIRKTKRVGGRGVDLKITIILDPWFF